MKISDKKNDLMLACVIFGIWIFIVVAGLVIAESQGDLEAELAQLEGELGSLGYDWIVNYSVDYPSVEVYRENSDGIVAVFENISSEGWYKVYLTNLSENESYDVFDLKVIGGGVEFDYIVDPTIIITDISAVNEFLMQDVVEENNFTHLNISDVAPYDSLVLYMPFDTNTSATSVYDYSGEGNDGTIVGGQDADSGFTTNGMYGGAEMFDGVGDYVTLANSVPYYSNFTISGWIKRTQSGRFDLITGGTSNAYFGYHSNNLPVFSYSNATESQRLCWGTTPITDNSWHYLVVSALNASSIKIYLDGVDDTSGSCAVNAWSNTRSLVLNTYGIGNFAGLTFNGTIDDVMIFNTSLTQEQITDLYNNQSARFKPTGNQTYKFQTITAGGNEYNLTSYFQNNMNTNVSARVGHWDVGDSYLDSDFAGESSLVGYWHMDESVWDGTAGEVIDAMGLNNGTAVDGNASVTTSGLFGNAGEFDGAGDYVEIQHDNSLNLTNSGYITVSAWAKTTSGNNYDMIFSNRDGLSSPYNGYDMGIWVTLYKASCSAVNTSTSEKRIYSSTAITDGDWNHILCVWNESGNLTLYVNGVQENTIDISVLGGNFDQTGNAYIGSIETGTHVWNGTIDEVAIYNRSLSADEIKQLYIKGRADWVYTDYKNLSSSGGTESFVIDTDATHVLQDFKFIPDSYQFYTPLLSSIDITGTQQNFTLNISDVGVIQANITYPLNITYANYVTALNYTIGSDASSCWYSIDAGVFNYTAVNAGTNWTGLSGNSSLGSNTWTLWCNDSAGNENVTSVSFVVDDVAPTTTIDNPIDGQSYASGVRNINVTTSGANSSVLNIDGSLVSWWRMDDVSGSTVIDYMSSNNGTAVDGAHQVDAGYFGKGFEFDGNGDYVDVGNNALNYSSDTTVSMWIYALDTTNFKRLFNTDSANSNDFLIGFFSNQLYLDDGLVGGVRTGTINTGQWYHVVGVFNYTNIQSSKIYLNGIDNTAGTIGATMSVGTTTRITQGTTQSFNGTLDDVMIFNRSLTAHEIIALYNATALNYLETFDAGEHTITAYAQDLAGNMGTDTNSFSIDLTNPSVVINSPIETNYSNATIIFNVSTDEEGTGSLVSNLDNSLVSWWRMDDVNQTGEGALVEDYMHCYDNETKILTLNENGEEEWKLFDDLDDSDKVMTLNAETGEKEWEVPMEYQEFEHDGEMYVIEVEEKDGERGELVVSPEHKVYVNSIEKNTSELARGQLSSKDLYVPQVLIQDKSEVSRSGQDAVKINEEDYLSSLVGVTKNSKEKKKDSNGMVKSCNLLIPNYDIYNGNNYINLSWCNKNLINKENATENVALMVMQISQDCNCLSEGKYINFSVCRDVAGKASVASMVMHSFEKRGLPRLSGSIPGGGVPAFNFSLEKITKTYSRFNQGEDVYFLDSKNELVKILSIEKEKYNGKIYDVDVPNDIILVERGGLVVWSGNSNNGTAVGNAVQTDAGKLGKGFEFDGDGDEINMGNVNLTSLETGGTISAWAYNKGLKTYGGILTKSAGGSAGTIYLEMGHYTSNQYTMRIGNLTSSTAESVVTSELNTWHHLVMTWNSTKLCAYFQGVLDSCTTIAYPFYDNGNNLLIGSLFGASANRAINGTIDDVMIFNRSLSADEITALYNATAINHNSTLSEGSHSLTAYSQDRAGNVNNTESVSFSIDTTYPQISIAYPVNATIYSINISELNYTVDSADYCWYSVDAGVTNSSIVNAGVNWTGLSGVNDANTWTVYCNDSAGNLNSTSVTFYSTYVSACGSLTQADTIYTLQNDLSTSGDCLTIGANNITVDGAGYSIIGDGGVDDYGIQTNADSDLVNITIKNFGNIGNFSRGIYLDMVNNSLIYNNTMISQIAYDTYAVYLEDGDSNNIENNTIGWNATGASINSYGVYLKISSGITGGNNNITGNNLNVYSALSNGYGVVLYNEYGTSMDSNIFQSNTINVDASLSGYGFYLSNDGTSMDSNIFQSNTINVDASLSGYGFYWYRGTSNTIYNETINVVSTASASALRSYGVYLSNIDLSNISLLRINASAPNAWASDIYLDSGSSHNVFYDNNLLGGNWSTYILASGGTNNTFVNTSYGGGEFVGTSAELIRKWYYQAYVNDSNGNAVIANVTAINSSDVIEWTVLTNSSGWIAQQEITEYTNVSGTTSYATPHTMNATNSSYHPYSESYVVTGNDLTANLQFDVGNVISCGTLGIANKTYTLQNDLSTTGTCLTIGANNITIDMAGYNITGDANSANDYGISNSGGYNYTSVKNGGIYQIGAGIYSNGNNGNFTNLTIITSSSFGFYSSIYGIYLLGDDNYITNSNISISNAGSSSIVYGIYLSTSSNNTIQENIVNSNIGTFYGYGIFLTTSSNNNTLTDITANSNSHIGIYLYQNSNNTLTDIIANSNTQYGIYIFLSSNNNLTDITANSNSFGGIYSLSSSNNTLTNITTNSNSRYGIFLDSSSNNSINNFNIWNSSTGGAYSGIYVYESSNNTFENGYVNQSGNYGIYLDSLAGPVASNNMFKDMWINNTDSSDVYVKTDNAGSAAINNTFLNVSYSDVEGVTDSGDGGAIEIIRKWYYQAYVNDTAGSAVVANVTAANSSGSVEFSVMTNSSGWMDPYQEITDYYVDITARYYYSNYTINATNSTYNAKSVSYNVTTNENNVDYNFEMGFPMGAVGIHYPFNTTYTNYVMDINYSQNNGAFCWYSNDGGVTNSSAVVAGVNWTDIENKSVIGGNTWTVFCNDTDGYVNGTSVIFTVDDVYPAISYDATTDADGLNKSVDNIFVNVSSSDAIGNVSTFIDFDGSLVSWWRMDDVEGTKVVDYMHCYDNETKVMTSDGWKYFEDLNDNDEIATLNSDTGEVEYHKPFEKQVYEHDGEMYVIETAEGELVVSPEHKVYVGEGENDKESLDGKSFFVNQIMMVKVLKNENVIFKPENKNKTSNLNSFERAQIMPEIFEMLDGNAVTSNNLLNLFIKSNSEIFVFPFEFVNNFPQFFRNFKFESHLICINLSNPSTVMDKCSPSAIALSFFTYSSLTSNSSIGYQSILSQNSWSSSDSSPVLMNPSNIFCFINLTTALAKNSESNFSLCLINSSILTDNNENNDYLSFSIQKNLSDFSLKKITDVYKDINENNKEIYFLDENNNQIKVKSITKVPYSGKIYDVDVSNDIILVERGGLVVWSGNSNNGTAVGNAVQTDAGYMGKGFSFDGVSGYINVANEANFDFERDNNFSFSFWFKTGQTTGHQMVISKLLQSAPRYNGYELRIFEGKIKMQLVNYWSTTPRRLIDVDTVETFSDNLWHQVILTYTGFINASGIAPATNVKIYVDGSQKSTTTNFDHLDGSILIDQNLVIGQRLNGGSFFNGTIDDVLIFNRSLSAEEVQALYANSTSKYSQLNFTGLTDGDHTFKAYTQDMAGNVNDSLETRTVSVDTGIPSVSIAYPVNATIYSINVSELNYTVDSADYCWYSVDAGVTNSTSVSAGTNFTGLSGVDDANTWTIYCNDSAGNENSTDVTFYSSYVSSCGSLTQANTVYTLQNDISTTGSCLIIGANNITIDMNGYNITGGGSGTGTRGIDNTVGYNYTSVKNGEIHNFGQGINSNNGNNGNFTNLTISGKTTGSGSVCIVYGIYLTGDNNNLQNINASSLSTSGCSPINIGYGIYLTSSSNNNQLTDITANSNTYGIYLGSSSNNNQLTDITANSNSLYGIYIYSSSNNNQLTDITANSNTYGIYLGSSSNNNQLTDITANSNSQYGIYIYSSSNNSFNNFNIWNSSTAVGTFAGIYVYESSNNTFTSGNVNLSGDYGVYLYSSSGPVVSNNMFKNMWIDNTVSNDVYVKTDNAGSGAINNTFLNVSYSDVEGVTDSGDGGAIEIIRKWYYQAYVNDTAGSAVVANVSATNSSGSVEFSVMTNSSGWIASPQGITDYVNNGTARYYYSNYTVNALNSSYPARNHTYNVTASPNKLDDLFTLDNVLPFIDYTTGTAINGASLSQNYIYVNVTVSEDYAEDTISFLLHDSNGLANLTSFTNSAREITWIGLGDGAYSYNVTVNDTAGNSNTTTTRTVTLDNDLPLITLLYPLEEVYNYNVTQLNYTVDGSGLCWHSNDGGVNNGSVVTAGVNFTGLSGVNGENTWTVFCNDSSGNLNSTSITFHSTYVTECTTLNQPGYTYTLYDDLTTAGDCLLVTADNITVDGDGYNITGMGGASDYGIYTNADSDLVNLTIKDFGNIGNFTSGIYLDMVNNSLIYNNTMNSQVAQDTYAVYLEDGDSNNIENNTIGWNATGADKTSYGVYLKVNSGSYGNNNVTGNNLTINSVSSSGYGVRLYNYGTSNSNTIQFNIIDVNASSPGYGVYLSNIGPGTSMNSNTIQSNTINVYSSASASYFRSYGVRLYNYGTSDSNTIQSNTIDVTASSVGFGVYLYNSGTSMNSNTIYNQIINVYSSASASYFRSYGVYLYSADLSNISSLTINASAPTAWASDIYLDSGSNSNTVENNVLQGGDYGIYITGSDSNNFTDLNITQTRNKNAVYVLSSSDSNRFVDLNISDGSTMAAFNVTSGPNDFINNTVGTSSIDYYFSADQGEFDFRDNSLEVENANGAVRFLNTSLYVAGSNLPNVISMTDNNIFVNSSSYPGFNTTANVTLKGLSVAVAEEVVDFGDSGTFVDCPADICANLSFDGSTFVFNVTHFTSYSSELSNDPPHTPVISFNTSGAENVTSENLICTSLIDDPDGDALNVSVKWYLNGTLNQTIEYYSQTNNTYLGAILLSGNTTKHQNWSCSIRFFDGQDYSAWVNSSNITIVNDVPTVTLMAPSDASATTNRTPLFSWSVSDDDAEDSHTYDWNLTSNLFSGADVCSDPNRYLTGLGSDSYVPSLPLSCLWDNGYYYTWRVRANDSEGYGDWSLDFIVNITADTSISLTTADMNFGSMGPLEENDTTDDSPAPLVIQNDGNSLLNISINASAIWTAESEDSSYYQAAVDNVSGEEGAFSWLTSLISWFNIPITGEVVAINQLNYSDSKDSAEVDIRVEVPTNEAPGAKSSLIVFYSRLAE